MPRQQFSTPVATFGPFPDTADLVSSAQLQVTDTRNTLQVIDVVIHDQETGAVGELVTFPYGQVGIGFSKADGTGWNRVAGRCVQMVFTPSDRNTYLLAGVAPTLAAGDRSLDSFTLVHEDGKLIVSTPAGRVTLATGKANIRPMPYLLTICFGTATTELLLSTFGNDTAGGMDDGVGIPQYPTARRVYVDITNTLATFFVTYQLANTFRYPRGSSLESIRIRDLTDTRYTTDGGTANYFDRVNRANSANNPGTQYTVETGTWGITNNAIRLQATAGAPGINTLYARSSRDGLYLWRFRLPGTLPFFGPTFAHSGPGNYLRIFNNGGNDVLLQVVAGGVPTGQVIAGISGPVMGGWKLNQTNEVLLLCRGNRLHLMINRVPFTNGWQTDTTNTYLNGSGIGMTALDNGFQAEWTHLAHYSHTEKLPIGLRQRRHYLPIGSCKQQIFAESFTGANGTTFASRGFTVHSGTATIQNNAGVLTGAAQNIATIDAGVPAFEASVDVVLPPQAIRYTFLGLVLWLDANNYVYYRCAIDKVLQPEADEIERGWMLNGAAQINGKVQMDGLQYVPNAVRRLMLRKWKDGRVQVYLDGYPRLSDRLPVALRGVPRVGIIRASQDADTSGNPTTVKNFAVYRLGA